ncbi:HNH endonuclease [Pantoea agglomerans]|uniref:HNH endonuclease n=1 Tax=Enterobacter agglomerans TaxID=549 RepID=UPI0009BD06FC|nr:HNH endonuclease signature motif containing protein [Pantoea agglomerans]QXB59582.1 HNH endonuclease [Pantoea agglomerans]
MMDTPVLKAWAFKTIKKSELRYQGNNGYDDNPTKSYSYDNLVANHKQVKEGDIVIVYNRSEILGVTKIDFISRKKTTKEINDCIIPNCNTDKIRKRNKKKPKWRCSNGHEFAEAKTEHIPITKFSAFYSGSFIKLKKPYLLLESKIINHNKQLSIQEVRTDWALSLLNGVENYLEELSSDDSMEAPALFSKEDYRDVVNRSIKQRRGQKSFREKLIKSHPQCAISKSKIVDILEAAHIFPYRNKTHNHISNGMLLRADLHTLFDLNLIAINPSDMTLRIAKNLEKSEYANLDKKKIDIKHQISIEAIIERWKLFHYI